ncbi:MAG: NUDIX domain-containing protein [Cellulomonadaceae bacterium]|jgi:8-oxo-dGTP diphosphatase|nr:NUDIX domain-containing protein [Cellulomonadaceae bacterium]
MNAPLVIPDEVGGQHRRLVVAAALVDSLECPTKMLAARRTHPDYAAGKYEFPGGKVEECEQPAEALLRELREELGIEVELGPEIPGPDHLSGHDGWFITDRHIMRVWLARLVSGVPVPRVDHDHVRWLTASTVMSVDWLEGDLPIVRELARRLFQG